MEKIYSSLTEVVVWWESYRDLPLWTVLVQSWSTCIQLRVKVKSTHWLSHGDHSYQLDNQHSALLALSSPSIKARVLSLKTSFFCWVLSSESDTIATRTLLTLASQDVYSLEIVQQCIALDSKLETNAISIILNNVEDPKHMLKEINLQLNTNQSV